MSADNSIQSRNPRNLKWKSRVQWRLTPSHHASAEAAPAQTRPPPPRHPLPQTAVIQTRVEIVSKKRRSQTLMSQGLGLAQDTSRPEAIVG